MADQAVGISIHAPRGGSDNLCRRRFLDLWNFNPRSPWGERPVKFSPLATWHLFQSTLPVGGATCTADDGDSESGDFNPRSPWGERPQRQPDVFQTGDFNPRSPWGERPAGWNQRLFHGYFNPRSPWGERPLVNVWVAPSKSNFNPRSPWGERPH